MYKAIVISPNDKTVDVGSLLAVARAEACRREHTTVNPVIRALVFVAEIGIYVAVYEAGDCVAPASVSKFKGQGQKRVRFDGL